MNKNNRIIRCVLCLVLALAMVFAPVLSSYAVMITVSNGDPVTAAEDETSDVTDISDDSGDLKEAEQADTAADSLDEQISGEEVSDIDSSDSDSEQNAEESSDAAEQKDDQIAEELRKNETADEDPEPEAVKTEYVYQGNGVKVTAVLDDPAAIPDDATLVATPITKDSGAYNYSAYMDALNRGSESSYDESNTLLYDIAFVKDGIELQPATGNVSVNIDFLDSQLSESLGAQKSSDISVIHLPLADSVKDQYDSTADASDISAEDIIVEEVTKAENGLSVSVQSEEVSFATGCFSVFAYTVDFEYTDPETGKVYTYNLAGSGSITLKELAIILGITSREDADEFIRSVDDVTFSNENLVKVEKRLLKGWVLTSLAPFSTEELLTISLKNGTVIQVNVTDVQESDNLQNFLTNVIITGATQTSPDTYEVEQGEDYSIILAFSESSSYQFANDQTLKYQIPSGISVIREQSGEMKINIVYRGRTYQVDATYDLDTTGLLEMNFDQSDPDYHRLVESTNVSFRFNYHAQFDGTATEIKFSDEIVRELEFDEPAPGQAYAEKSAVYDERTGKFTYTIKITADGDVTNVNVKDVISGNALIFNNDVIVRGNSSNYTDNGAINGFDYTFASMRDGEEIIITYSANVDFSKDVDGNGKITADQTKNTVTVKPDEGEPHTSEYSREITFKGTNKGNGTEAGTTADGDKIIEWTIDYNELALVSAGGDIIKDTISASSASYMKYYGDGITVEVRDRSGQLIRTDSINYENLTAHSDSSWTYTIPSGDTVPYSYHITYKTVVDMEKVNSGTGTAVTLENTSNDDSGTVIVGPDKEISVVKNVESFDTQKVNWIATLTVPEGGLSQATVTDSFPQIYVGDDNFWDAYETGSLEIDGLLPGESYTATPSAKNLVITFFQDSAKTLTGLQAHPGGHTITVRLTTTVNQEWLQKGYESSDEYEKKHTNTIVFNSKTATATVLFDKPGIEKTGERAPDDERGILYTIKLKGVSDVPVSVSDTFDTSLLEVDTSRINQGLYGDHMRIRGGVYGPSSERVPVSYSDTTDGIILTANSVPMQDDGHYYPYYWITYYLKLKDGVDLEQLAIDNGGEYDLINTAVWAGHETSYTHKTIYDYLDKELLNAGEIGGTDRTARYRITFNKAKAVLNGGNPMEMTDVLSSNLSIDYSSIQITTDPPGAEVPYSLSGGKDEHGDPDGTTIATYTVPDATQVVITYDAFIRGNGSQKIVNKVSVNGRDETVEDVNDYGSATEGTGAIASLKIVKVDGYDANKKLEGVQFKIFAEDPDLNFGPSVDNAKEITLTTDENGEIILDGAQYRFYFNKVYHVQEVDPPPDYGNLGFDYLVTMTADMARVDYGHFIYYYNDTMQIKNWPLEGLVVEKEVESDEAADHDRYYTFRISILDENGEVDTTYNEKNGDDQFENGVVEFKLKDKEQKMFWGFLKGTRYKVEEIDAEGFATDVTYSIFDEDGNVTDIITDKNTDSHTGELTQEDEVIVFKNSKTQESGSLKIKKNVTVNGKATTGTSADGTYTFTITGPDGYSSTQTITITNGVSNEVQVDDLVPGTYTVSEDTSKNPEGMTLTGENDIEVEVEAGEEAEIKTAEFTNNLSYAVGEVKVKKTLSGREWKTADSFEFTITPIGEAPEFDPDTVTVTKDSADYTESFGKVKLSKAGTYQWTVSETHKGETINGVAYDSADKTVTIVVNNDGDGNLVAEEGSALVQTAAFTNTYAAKGVGEIKVQKVLEGRDWTNGDSFTFTIAGKNGAPMPAVSSISITKSDKKHTKSFGEIRFSKAGTYTYVVKESKGSLGGVTYDETEHEVTIKVVDNGKGKLVAAEGSNLIQTETFTNTYAAKGAKGNIKVQKLLQGRAWNDSDQFTFKLSAENGAPLPAQTTVTIRKSDADHIKSFGEIDFTKAGKYTYTVRETKGNIKGVNYDTKAHKVTIEVVDDGNGHLIAKKGTSLIQTVKITNTTGVKTGDENRILLPMTGMFASMIALLLIVIRRRKSRA